MKPNFIFILGTLTFFFIACKDEKGFASKLESVELKDASDSINTKGNILSERIIAPKGYHRIEVQSNSFASYLRNIALRPHDAEVKYFDGSTKSNNNVYCAVVDQNIGARDLHQCADAVIRLKADYHWRQKEFDKIHFNLTNGFNVPYKRWMEGDRVKVTGNKTEWYSTNKHSNTYDNFWSYLEFVFTYAGTASLSKELESVPFKDIQIGDVLIQGGFPGHAVIVMDLAFNPQNNKKLFLLAQSYMPAQTLQILINPRNSNLSPWYELNDERKVITPEWTFSPQDLKRFSE